MVCGHVRLTSDELLCPMNIVKGSLWEVGGATEKEPTMLEVDEGCGC